MPRFLYTSVRLRDLRLPLVLGTLVFDDLISGKDRRRTRLSLLEFIVLLLLRVLGRGNLKYHVVACARRHQSQPQRHVVTP